MVHAAISVTHYCERTSEAFWAEPVNALSNIAIIGAALLIARQLKTGVGGFPWDVGMLVGLALATGSGSFLWHTFATPWSAWADVIPIALFISLYLVSFLRRVARLSWSAVLLAFVFFQLLNSSVLVIFPADLFNGSVAYLPTLGTLLLITLAGYHCGWRQAGRLSAMSLLFSVSLLLRTLDAGVCSAFPIGTHFAWHLLNAAVLYLAMRSLMD